MTMLDRMRRHRGWLKWSLGLVAVTMVIFFIPQDYLQPTTSVALETTEAAKSVLRLIDALDDHDDVQNVSANFDIDDSLLQQLESV